MQSILGNTRKTDITFHHNGRIDISARVAKMLSLRKGDVIDLLYGDRELYLYVRMRAPTVGRHEAACFPTHANSRHFRTWSQRLCHAVEKASCANTAKVELSVGLPVKLNGAAPALPVIYKHILNRRDDTGD